MRGLAPFVLVSLLVSGCGGGGGPPECGSLAGTVHALIPGPGEAGYDAELERLARQYDRQFHAINAFATALGSDVFVARSAVANRARIERFLREGTGFDFEAETGTTAAAVVTEFQKSAGAFAGAALAGDAFRYGVLRDRGDACQDVETARAQLVRGLESLHRAFEITGAHGVVARSLVNGNLAFGGAGEIVPLFDDQGHALPLEKNNGTWRADASGRSPGWIWEDSASRDMVIGWALGLGSAWEVIETDDTIPEALKANLSADALAFGQELKKVRPSGYDLEIIDADGRTTFHGYLNENTLDRAYIDIPENGFVSAMALGTVAVMAQVSGDAELRRWLIDELAGTRDLDGIAARSMVIIDLGVVANFSNYNMAFTGTHLALRYIDDGAAEIQLRAALRDQLYAVPGRDRQPSEMKQTFFDFVMAAGMAGSTRTQLPAYTIDDAAIRRGLETLREFPEPPYWETLRTNCDAQELASSQCTLDDGTPVTLLGDVGRGDKLIAASPIPMRVRPPSNFHWRSNPYEPNGGGDTGRLLPGSDFRMAYWLGRWIRRSE